MDMAKFPFKLEVNSISPQSRRVELICLSRIRSIPNKRDVYDAVFEGRGVIVKVFRDKMKAGLRCQKEWNGLLELGRRDIRAPEPLLLGRCSDGARVLVIEKIVDSQVVNDYFGSLGEGAEKVNTLRMVCRELADQHKKGVLQSDLHLGNFLLKDEKLYTIDPAKICFISGEVSMRRSLKQLAGILCSISDDDSDAIRQLCGEYFERRGYEDIGRFIGTIMKYRAAQKERNIKITLRKSLRTSKRNLKINAGQIRAVFRKDFLGDSDPYEFVGSLDEMMDGGEILKRGNTCYVSRAKWNGKDVVIKRYNNKGIVHSFRHSIKGSRARKNWLFSQRLEMLGIANPAVMAYGERRRAGFILTSYVVTEFVDAIKLHDFLDSDDISEDRHKLVIDRVGKLLGKLEENRICHGDLKDSNILLPNDEPMLLDLDSMKKFSSNWFFKIRFRKDINRIGSLFRTNKQSF